MIRWNTNSSRSSTRKQIAATLMDMKICEACLNDYQNFRDYLDFIEYSEKSNISLPAHLQSKLLDGINNLNWDGYFSTELKQ